MTEKECPFGLEDCPKVRQLRDEVRELRRDIRDTHRHCEAIMKIAVITLIMVVAFHGAEALAILGAP